MSGEICTPGMRICALGEKLLSGPGTYVLQGYIYASLTGVMHIIKQDDGKKSLVEVRRSLGRLSVPSPGAVVTCKVTAINQRYAKVAILCIEEAELKEPFRGVIRKEDVRAFEKDKVEIIKSFHPGDIVLAKVLTMGDAMSYILTTAENELGVVIALAESSGMPMVPISWTEMQCPKSLEKEYRKVAKIVPTVKEI
ncbi:exosome complex component CSL4-like [Varroa jacobsoni]|uniref:Exosome complex component CSL4 n=1 Tax=Varroa destructor TaxID=109461 RepID=A0A7M7K1G1_VARDE|nr:exosome complex component CSL4-like [Varroa destructor]XP_022689882.1 exosome complex component CSL4-like [Varroa jacobsoni]